ncbi:hypothetical protein B5V89_14175 [Heyndrickxia sporothermodurans]|uniref:LXG domain-containing protein n=1 Tax=Heyndrickxia sporothermodurans TaxID=46224 RepID=UPI000D3A6E5A|nr:LXG domain-containing protein [Heyndrickxia sporothermodurans]PTY77592.1 hypothetical protein B5V89_14175 [Heyndrickxia sporothermodurans]
MRVLKVSEINNGIDQLINKKKEEKRQILAIHDAMEKVINLDDALKGEGGNAIKDYYNVLHFPIILLFNQFLENYVQELKNIKNVVKHYETEDGFIKEEFIHHDVMNGITKVEKETHDIVKSINEDLYKVNDLVAAIPIKTINFDAHISSAKRQIRKTIEDINQLDQSSTVKLEDPGKDLTNIH